MKTYAEYRKQVEEALSGQLRSLGEIPDILLKAMEYSLLAGGKRLRAVLLLAACHASGWVADGKAILMTVYLACITPACSTVTSMAQLYGADAEHSSALYVLTTLLSIVSMPVMIGLFDLLL